MASLDGSSLNSSWRTAHTKAPLTSICHRGRKPATKRIGNKYRNPMEMNGFVCQSTMAIATIKTAAAIKNRLRLSPNRWMRIP